MQPAIFAQGIGKSFRERMFGPHKVVLREVDLEVAPGAIFGVLGPNGAGKTTLISILATLLHPDAGSAQVLGLDVLREARQLRQRINLAAAGAHFLWCLTAEENLRFYGRLYGLGGRVLAAKVEGLIELFELREHRRVVFDRLSTGLKQRLMLAKALINDPELLFLDEPTSGLDQDMARHIREDLLRLNRDRGLTILLTTHNLREAEMLCSEVAFLKEGRLAARGTIPDLQRRLGLGDHLSLVFRHNPPPLEYANLPGVLTHRVQDSRVDLVLDRAEIRLAAVLEVVYHSGRELAQVKVKPVDSKRSTVKLPISFHQIWAFTVRSSLVNRRNVFAIFEMLFWPAIGIFSVGLLTRFLNLSGETVTFILIGAIAMNTIQIGQLDLSYALLYSVWSKSLKHEFIAPIRLGHILVGAGFMGLIRGFLVFLVMAVLSVGLFNMDLSRPGAGGLAILLAGMFLNAAVIGAVVLALVLRFGQRAEVAAWAFSYLMLLLCGLYYPVSVFPADLQVLAQFIPLTYFLEYFRHFYGFPLHYGRPLLYGFSLSVLYLLISYGLLHYTLRSAYRRGTLLRLSE